MDKPGLDADWNCESVTESLGRYPGRLHGQGDVMYNLFGPGSSFRSLRLLHSDSCSSSDPVRADCSLNDAIHTTRNSSGAFQHDLSVQNYVPIDNHNYDLKESYCGVDDLLDDNNPVTEHSLPCDYLNSDDKIASSLSDNLVSDGLNIFCRSENAPTQVENRIQEESKRSLNVSETKPLVSNSFLTMENSNNAIDNNLHSGNSIGHSLPANAGCISGNHIFKLPNNELTFNGTLKHLQKLQPIVDSNLKQSSLYKEDYKYIDNHDNGKEESVEEAIYKSSDEVTSNSPQSESAGSSKSGITIFSSVSQFPSDCEVISDTGPPSKKLPTKFSDILDGSTSVNKTNAVTVNYAKKLSFAGTLSPLKINGNGDRDGNHQGLPTVHNRSGESLDSSYSSGAQSPNMFSDEDDYVDTKIDINKTDLILKEFEKYEKLIIQRLEKTLQGVPPPPSVTICQLTATDLLNLYNKHLAKFNCKESKQYYDEASITPPRRTSCDINSDPAIAMSLALALENTVSQAFSTTQTNSTTNLSTDAQPARSKSHESLQGNFTENFATNADWPHLLESRFYGVHYNSTIHTEQVDCLLSKYVSRFVGCETASSCVSASSLNPPRRVVRPIRSPGQRLSHLARRRVAFCSAASILDTSTAKRQILIDRKKFSTMTAGRLQPKGKSPRTKRTPGKRTPGKRTPARKTPGKKTPGKKTPSSSQKKRGVRRLLIGSEPAIKAQPTRETSKRALFLSPDNIVTKPIEKPESVPRPSTSRVMRSKRALFGSPAKEDSDSTSNSIGNGKVDVVADAEVVGRKRGRLDDSLNDLPVSQKTKLQKSFSFGGDQLDSSYSLKTIQRRASEYFPSNRELDDVQRKKLIWAVAEALRPHGISVTHPQFKQHASVLARLTRKLSFLPPHATALRCPTSSTSDTLLKIARLYVFAVIKGRSVEELFAEEQAKHANMAASRITGYVPLSAYEPNKVHTISSISRNSENSYGDVKSFKSDQTSNMKTVLQDKTVNIDSRSNGSSNSNSVISADLKKPLHTKDGNKLRARRQISFDNMEDPAKR